MRVHPHTTGGGLMGSRSWISFVVAIFKKQRLKESNIQTNKGYRFGILSILIIGIVLLLLLLPIVSAAAPVAQFTGTPINGSSPLPVTFTDTSAGNPTGWAWYFGDETYTAPWTQVNASAGWTARTGFSSVAMPDGSIVLMGGSWNYSVGNKNDVWRSTDNGATWMLVNASAGWTARIYHCSVAMPDGSIVLTGGSNASSGDKNDVWRSNDYGATWMLVNASAEWTARAQHRSVVMPDGSIVLMGGHDNSYNLKNDVWRSNDYGATWMLVNASAGWTARRGFSSIAMPDGSIVLMGGYDNSYNLKNDVWRSTDNGATWTQVNASTGWTARRGFSSIAMPDGSIVLMGGYDSVSPYWYKNDMWRSTDNGATWTQVNASTGWTARNDHSSVAMPDGSIVLMGGHDNSYNLKNDVWWLMLAGSSAQNPTHTYTAAGTYSVALQAYNAGGYNNTRKISYITVTALPVASFTGTPTSGTAPLTVSFTDTSTGTPSTWNWLFGDNSTSTTQNPVHVYATPGNYTVSLIIMNADGSNTTVRTDYITVNVPAPVADFTANVTFGTAPLTSTSLIYHRTVPPAGHGISATRILRHLGRW